MVIVLLARLVLAAVFAVSAPAKWRDPSGTRRAVSDFGLAPWAVGPIAALLAPVELTAALLLLTTRWAVVVGALLAGLLLVGFTVVIVRSLRRGEQVECHCFGVLSSEPVNWWSVARNAGLLVLAGVVLAGGTSQGWPWQVVADWLTPMTTSQRWLWAAVVVLVLAVVVLTVLFVALLRRYGQVLLRLDALETTPSAAHASHQGHSHDFAAWTAPDVEVVDESGSCARAERRDGGRPGQPAGVRQPAVRGVR